MSKDKRMDLIDSYGEDVILAYEDLYGEIETNEESEHFLTSYVGTYKDRIDFAWGYLDETCYSFNELPDFIKNNISMEKVVYEMFIDDFWDMKLDNGNIAVFYRG